MRGMFGFVSKEARAEIQTAEKIGASNVYSGAPEDHYVLTCLSLYSESFERFSNTNKVESSIGNLMRAIDENIHAIDPAYILECARALNIVEVKPVWDRLRELESQSPQKSNHSISHYKP